MAEAPTSFHPFARNLIRTWLQVVLPAPPALVLDIGGDAAWMASEGWDVVSVGVAPPARDHLAVRWIDDRLPALDRTFRLGLTFDAIHLADPWLDVVPSERARAFRKLVTLLKPGGRLAIDLHDAPEASPGSPATRNELERLARDHGLVVEAARAGDDIDREAPVRLALRLPDDGTGALPLLRHIILNDSKAATYKLALLRVLCRIADGAAGMARDIDEGFVGVPLGLVALYWIRLFKPLLAHGLPQTPGNVGDQGLGFVRDGGFRALHDVSPLDLRVGATFGAERMVALHRALRDAASHIEKMPAHFTTYAAGAPVFPIRRDVQPGRPASSTALDASYLSSFGTLLVPRHLWRAFQRFDVWIEPSLTTEWKRLVNEYADRQGRPIAPGMLDAALQWSDPERDVAAARQRALQLLEMRKLHCVWTGKVLTADNLDIDHCFPWSAWPCEDLWNLMPSHRRVNQDLKRNRLPGLGLLRASQDRIVEWWNESYLAAQGTLPERFLTEARATLPTLGSATVSPEDVFSAVTLQQARLRHDQQVPVWEPAEAGG